eukprot:TRINITY_DN5864_c0_g2_i1.p1 TRINITY_DN5864_c0_g2~~TRINITY_DN5864_c0_g2_i1.p1  ORF type:complete len:345 (-),score=95.19 TRINITY_DN5864_c0_g2_i1:119-1153(-)
MCIRDSLHAVQFNAVANFIEILKIFGPLDDLWEERRRFCKYKGASILKCLKEGKDPPRGKPCNSEKVFKELFETVEPEEEKNSIVKRLTLTEEERRKIAEEEDRIKREELEAKRKFVERIKLETEQKIPNAELPFTPPKESELHFSITNNESPYESQYMQSYPSLHEDSASSMVSMSNVVIPTTGTRFGATYPSLEPDDVVIPVARGNFLSTMIGKATKEKDLINQLQQEATGEIKTPSKSEIPDEDVIIPFSHIKRNINKHEEFKSRASIHAANESTKLEPTKGESLKILSPTTSKVEDPELEKTVLRIMNNVEYALDELKFINVKNGKEFTKKALQDFDKIQ